MIFQILNSFSGDDNTDIDTSGAEGREKAAKLVQELLRSGSAVFLEKKVGDQTYTYRVINYNAETNKLTIRLDGGELDKAIESHPIRRRGKYRRSHGTVDAQTGRVVAVAPRSGG